MKKKIEMKWLQTLYPFRRRHVVLPPHMAPLNTQIEQTLGRT